jgi:hypothetical protein
MGASAPESITNPNRTESESIMNNEIETSIKTVDGVKVSLSNWDDGGAWLHLGMRGGTAYAALTRDEAQRLLEGLQAILAKEVTA